MSLRPHGRASISAINPRALGICDRCSFTYNLDMLSYQFQWRGPRLQNVRILVCETCYDEPQEQLRTFILPPDPIALKDPRPENYADCDNPASHLGYDPANMFEPLAQRGFNIGNLTLGAGVNAAFDGWLAGGVATRRFPNCANLANSNSSFDNWVGKNWNADASGTTITIPSTAVAVEHTVSGFTLYAPSEQAFLLTGATGYRLEGSDDGATWTTLYSGITAGTAGEVITVDSISGAAYPYHRISIEGDGISQVGIAQAVLNISDAGANEI